MPTVVGIDHLAIRVIDFEISRGFRDRPPHFLGLVGEWEFERTAGWNDGVTVFRVTKADAQGRVRPSGRKLGRRLKRWAISSLWRRAGRTRPSSPRRRRANRCKRGRRATPGP